MKKRIIALVATIIIALPIFTMAASRVQPRWTLINSATALCYRTENKYIGQVTCLNTVYKMDIDIVLYEKGFLTGYKEVSSIRKTVNNYVNTSFADYTFSSSKDYKIEMTVTAYSQSGQTETVTVSEEYT
ncbi:MAG: hypothetical protein IKK99_08725 [Oscillospiraceae bacterium]|nr:hypothetical protein [Oscillospiraceae bacterium]